MYDAMPPIQGANEGRHVSKSELKQALMLYLQGMGRPVSEVVEIGDTPGVCKHACIKDGQLYVLNQEIFEYIDIKVPFYYCSICGKVRVWLDF